MLFFSPATWSQSTGPEASGLNTGRLINYPEIFGEDWKKAVAFEQDNRYWIEPLLTRNNISYPLAISVIFPELVRYSALRDKMEITLLKALYINLGDTYANFSIGQFQMKPSFAEMLCELAPVYLPQKKEPLLRKKTDFYDINDFRKTIIKDLEDPHAQLNYLITFLKICDKKFKLRSAEETFKVKFLATAYNYSFNKTADEIEKNINRKFFNTRLYKTENYCYADVSLYWYSHYTEGK